MTRTMMLVLAVAGLVALTAGAAPRKAAPRAATARGVAQRVTLTVTPKGFEPPVVTVEAGKPVDLLITRRTEQTCATDFVLAAYRIHQALPLNRTVTVRFTPRRAGELVYACGMDMIHGRIVVR